VSSGKTNLQDNTIITTLNPLLEFTKTDDGPIPIAWHPLKGNQNLRKNN